MWEKGFLVLILILHLLRFYWFRIKKKLTKHPHHRASWYNKLLNLIPISLFHRKCKLVTKALSFV